MLSLLVNLIIFFEKEGLQKETNIDVQVTGKISKETREKEITEISRSTARPPVSGASSIGKRGNPRPPHSAAVYTRVT